MMVAQIPSAPVDFAPANEAMCSEGSIFVKDVMVQKMTDWGPVSIDGDQFTSRSQTGKKVTKITSEEELQKILTEVFDIELPRKV